MIRGSHRAGSARLSRRRVETTSESLSSPSSSCGAASLRDVASSYGAPSSRGRWQPFRGPMPQRVDVVAAYRKPEARSSSRSRALISSLRVLPLGRLQPRSRLLIERAVIPDRFPSSSWLSPQSTRVRRSSAPKLSTCSGNESPRGRRRGRFVRAGVQSKQYQGGEDRVMRITSRYSEHIVPLRFGENLLAIFRGISGPNSCCSSGRLCRIAAANSRSAARKALIQGG